VSKTRTQFLSTVRGCWALLLTALLLSSGCATHNIVQAPTGRFELKPGGFNQVSVEQEVQLGQQAAQQVYQQYPVLPDSNPITQYVQQLGQKLASHAPGEVKWPFAFHVVATKEINAFALPGGPLFVNLGVMTAADNEGQLAGVIAHEISHVVLRHSTEQASKAMLAQIPLAVLGAVVGGGAAGQLAQLGIQFGAESVFLKYSRDAEKEADLLGSQIMYDAGYDPYDMVEFFDKLEKQGGGGGAPQFLSDHPNPGNRVEYVKEAISKYPRKRYSSNDAQFDRIKQLAAKEENNPHPQRARAPQGQGGAPQAQPTMQPVPLEQVIPSQQFKPLDHSAFQIQYPANWQAMGDANSNVTIAPQAGVAQGAVAYGVIISGFQPQQGRASLDAATQDLLATLQQGNPQMQQSGSPQSISVNGAPAISLQLTSPSPIQGSSGAVAERDWLVTVQRPQGGILFLIFIAPDQQFQQFGPAYEQMLRTLRLK
jgi:beta-barrel assembly-enhancing protease